MTEGTGKTTRSSSAFYWVVGSLITVLLTACITIYLMQPVRIETAHGHRIGVGEASVNGTAALSGMFESAGHRVFTWRRLSGKLDTAQTVVWFPDCFQPPKADERAFLERWLDAEPGRTLVYVGRDYTAAPEYWRVMQDVVGPDQYREYVRREAKALAAHNVDRAVMPDQQYARWFTVVRDDDRRVARKLSSSGGWLEGVDVEQTHIVLESNLQVPTEDDVMRRRKSVKTSGGDEIVKEIIDYDVLLADNGTPVVTRTSSPRWGSSKVIVVTNGSFLLNLPLVNKEHRKLAGKLIAECGEPDQVAFLETGPEGAFIFEESDSSNPNGLEMFTVWPMNAISLHVVAVGIVTCFLLWPIFGRPKDEGRVSVSDFYKHVVALGAMLERTHDEAFAQQRIAHYFQVTHRERQPTAAAGSKPLVPQASVHYDLPHDPIPANATKLAEHAVFVGANEHQVALDFTPASVTVVNNLLNSLHANNGAEDQSLQTFAFCLGVYVGEILVRHHQATWHDRSEHPMFAQVGPYMIVELQSIQVTGDQQQMLLNPIGKAMMQLETGSANSIEFYYRELIHKHRADSV